MTVTAVVAVAAVVLPAGVQGIKVPALDRHADLTQALGAFLQFTKRGEFGSRHQEHRVGMWRQHLRV